MNQVFIVALLFYGYVINLSYGREIPTVFNEASAEVWFGGTVITAHNYLSGDGFYSLENGSIVVAQYSDGNRKRFEVIQTGLYKDGQNWDKMMYKFSEPDHLTLYTCWPQITYLVASISKGRWFIELSPLDSNNDNKYRPKIRQEDLRME